LSQGDSLPWFRIQFRDGRTVEIHSQDALKIYERDFKDVFASLPNPQPGVEMGSGDAGRLESASLDNLPTSIEKPTGSEDAVRKVVYTPWARSKLRSPDELRNALQNCGYELNIGNISAILSNLFKKGEVRRQKAGKTFVYGPPIAA